MYDVIVWGTLTIVRTFDLIFLQFYKFLGGEEFQNHNAEVVNPSVRYNAKCVSYVSLLVSADDDSRINGR